MNEYGYWNGKILPVKDMRIDPKDLGVLRGYGVFDVMRTENNKPFLLEQHFARLEQSAGILNLTLPVSQQVFADIVKKLIAKNGLAQSNIRTVLTGGISEDAFLPNGKPTFFILITPFHGLEDRYYRDGAAVITLDFARDFPRAKITQYVTAIKNDQRKKEADALEIVYVQEKSVLEASTSNIGIFVGDTLVTPQRDILLGITRGLTLQLAREAGFFVEEREISLQELLAADEVFLTATNKYIVPVVKVDEHLIADGKPGQKTKKLMQMMREFCEKY